MPNVVRAAPPPEGVVPNLQHPEDVLHTINLVSQILSITSVSLFMMLRIYAKAFIAPPFHSEDLHHYGGGYHVYEISAADFLSLTSSLGLYADTLVYGPNSYFTKLALLLMVIRVFRLHKKTKIGIYVTVAVMSGYYAPVFFIKILICRPVRGFWDPTVEAACFNQRAVFVSDTVISAITDLAVLCLPIPVAVTLRMSWSRRLRVMAMLSAGGIATAVSIVRMIIVIRLQESTDESVDFIRFNLLGTAEVSIGMICSCFPAVNILLTHGFDCSQDSSRNTGSSSKKITELKFLRGSKLRTQEMTVVQVATADVPQQPPQQPPQHSPRQSPQQQREDYIFPIERLSRLPPSLQQGVDKDTWPDEWCSKLVSSPFSDPGAPDWARNGSVG
ncbi:integral membrane protein [Colletotrichum tofieldiae]|uniref:Integral membrane protein n=1 Tax=Colletotrichum tofieldiae TaxID=708197 RepID=A0A166YM79_9PEZI|nr:integral membrane protein [Colletotrichum tofieldiae]